MLGLVYRLAQDLERLAHLLRKKGVVIDAYVDLRLSPHAVEFRYADVDGETVPWTGAPSLAGFDRCCFRPIAALTWSVTLRAVEARVTRQTRHPTLLGSSDLPDEAAQRVEAVPQSSRRFEPTSAQDQDARGREAARRDR